MRVSIRRSILNLFVMFHIDKVTDKLYWDYFHGFKPASQATVLAIEKAFKLASKTGSLTNGDYYEFGVFKGYSLYSAKELAKKYSPNMRLFGFDSFEGIPKLSQDDLHEFYEGQFAVSKKQVEDNIRKKSGDLHNVVLIKGFFSETLTEEVKRKNKMRKASIINIDSDLYSSAVDVLRFCKSLIMKDTILLFDDWNSFSGERPSGEERALEEFLVKNTSIKVKKLYAYGWHGQAFKVEKI